MLLTVFNVFYILIAIAMIVLILLQRGAGADAGSGFGGGASATVFGARGSANFMSRTTAVLAGLFFLLSLGMGIYLGASGGVKKPTDDLGVMSGTEVPAATTTTDKAPAPPPATGDVPQATTPVVTPPAAAPSDKPAVPAPAPTPPAADKKKDGKTEEAKKKTDASAKSK